MKNPHLDHDCRTYINKIQQIIVNADDCGYNQNIDLGIFELLEKGRISSLSVMINGRNIVKAAKTINQFLQRKGQAEIKLSLGLHFNLTQGRPLSQEILSSGLVQNQQFIGKDKFYNTIVNDQSYQHYQIASEFKHQIKEFIRIFKRRPTHIDGHNHIHFVPKIAKIIADIMTEIGIYRARVIHEQLQTYHLPFNNIFLKNSALSQKIFASKNIAFASRFVGLQGFGNLSIKNIRKAIQQFNNCQETNRTVQVMCHPGIPDPNGTPWISSMDRLTQKKQLQSVQFENFLIQQEGLSSYLDLKISPKDNQLRALIYSKMQSGTGNQTTALRFKVILQQMNFQVYTWSCEQNMNPRLQVSDMQQFIMNFGISIVFGVNVNRSAQIIHRATCQNNQMKMIVPYILVIAGTDANITFKNEQRLKNIEPALRNSQCLISLSYDMTRITEQLLNRLKIDKKIYTIVQSSCLSQSIVKNLQWKQKNEPILFIKQRYKIDLGQKPFILFPTSFRKVKCVHHLFTQLNHVIEQYNFDVFIAGPILDQHYYDQYKQKIGKIRYLGVVSRQIYAQFLKKAFIVINTSESEGMSCSILEAFQFKVPVIARKNPGNEQLITHMHNGLIYDNPEQFVKLFRQLYQDNKLKDKLIQNSTKILAQRYSYNSEFNLFKNLINSELFSKTCIITAQNRTVRVLNGKDIHPTSELNNGMFLEIQPTIQDQAKIIDLGTGTGIFGIAYIFKSSANRLSVYLTDIKSQIVGHALYNYRQSSVWSKIESITCVKSDLFQKIDQKIHYNALLFNAPQTPFQLPQTRPDKNGGPMGIYFYQPVLSFFARSTIDKLYLLYSFMGWPTKFKELLQKYRLSIIWQSTKVVHKIQKSQYDEMQPNLSSYIEQHISKGRAQVELHGTTFYVPAVIYCIVRND